jgi:SAM-dependent methyltransferase
VREGDPTARNPLDRLTLYARWLLLRLVDRETFVFQGREYRYFNHPYNVTWGNERAVEVPIVRRAIEEDGTTRVLEVGNVLGHYFRHAYDVVDKYESGAGILNRDILDFRPHEPYDLIVSISTLEHVGFDEDDRDPEKIPRAVEHIRTLLAPAGRAIVTLPLGYNAYLDELVTEGALGVDRESFLLRFALREWREVDKADFGRPAYGSPFPGANGLMIGMIQRS